MNADHIFDASVVLNILGLSFSASVLTIGVIAWLFKNLITNRLKESVRFEFDSRLESLRSDIQEKATEIAALRTGALDTLANRHQALGRKRIEAAEVLWSDAAQRMRVTGVWLEFLSVLDLSKAYNRTATDVSLQKTFEGMLNIEELQALDLLPTIFARPFLTERAWATHRALVLTIADAVTIWTALRGGTSRVPGKYDLMRHEIGVALDVEPDGLLLGEEDFNNHQEIVGRLEGRLLAQLRFELFGENSDRLQLEQADNVLRLANQIRQETKAPSDLLGLAEVLKEGS